MKFEDSSLNEGNGLLGKEGIWGRREGGSPHLTYLEGREGVKSYFPCCIWFPLSALVMSH